MPSSSSKLADVASYGQDNQTRQQKRAARSKKTQASTPSPPEPPAIDPPSSRPDIEHILEAESASKPEPPEHGQAAQFEEFDCNPQPSIYPRQMRVALSTASICRAKSPTFAFAALQPRPISQTQPFSSPDLVPQSSPPGSLPRYDPTIPFSAFASRQSGPSPYSITGSPPVHHSPGSDAWFSGIGAGGSPPVSHYPRSPPYAVSPPAVSSRSRTSHRSASRDISVDFRSHQLPSALSNPPLPHQPQPHYYGLPNTAIGPPPQPKSGIRPGERGYYCGFGSFQPQKASSAHNLVFIGLEGGLDVYRSERAELTRIGHLEGLRGAVIGASLLTWHSRKDPFAAQRPLVALIVHGPILDTGDAKGTSDGPSLLDDGMKVPERGPVNYQTSVEVYSLQSQNFIATLYKSEIVTTYDHPTNPQFLPPAPIGELRVDSSSRFCLISSGTSGEVYVFTAISSKPTTKKPTVEFSCVGKYWTSVERCAIRERPVSGAGDDSFKQTAPERKKAVYSLRGRWLAITPPTASALASISGSPLVSALADKPPGLTQFTPPGAPGVDCIIESPDQESMFNRMARVATQEMIKGAQWVGNQGAQAWRNYWSKQGQISEMPSEPQHHDNWYPPTHGETLEAQEERNRSSLVSVIDLDRLLCSHRGFKTLEPIATFEAPEGCSCLSFSPSGLHLLTVSQRGNIQRVWDLLKIKPSRIGNGQASRAARPAKPTVRQIAKFQRLTDAHVIEVVWSEPKGDKLAVVTHRGTVHLFQMPSAAFQWPPRRLAADPGAHSAKRSDTSSHTNQAGFLPSAISALNGTVRKQASGLSALTSNLNLAHGRGRKAVASGVSKSLGAAAEGLGQLRHLGDNRLRLGQSPESIVQPGCVRFLTGTSRGYIGVLSGGCLRIHAMPRLDRTKSPSHYAASRDLEFPLPQIPDEIISPATKQALQPEQESATKVAVSAFWVPSLGSTGMDDEAESSQPLSFAEIETTSPFQPFHMNRRVTFSTYVSDSDALGKDDWAFGGALPTVTVPLGHPGETGVENDEDMLAAEQGLLGLDEDGFEVLDADLLHYHEQ